MEQQKTNCTNVRKMATISWRSFCFIWGNNKKTGQVCFLIRDVQGVDDNPFDFETVKKNIEERLNPKYECRFKIMLVPNITNICYGRGVGYKIEEIVMPEEIQKISATKIRAKMRDEGKLK